jgi:hypothetical protein
MWRWNINIKDRSVVAAALGLRCWFWFRMCGGWCAAILHNVLMIVFRLIRARYVNIAWGFWMACAAGAALYFFMVSLLLNN